MRKLNRVEARDYKDMTADRPLDTYRERECFRFLMQFLDVAPTRVLEIFGGIGVMSEVLQENGILAELQYHEAWDMSQQCCELLRGKNPGCCVRNVNSFKTGVPLGFDLVSCDFNTWTFLKYSREVPYYKLTNSVFESGATYVQLADSAVNKLHLNYEAYAVEFDCHPGDCEKPSGYFNQLSLYAQRVWGYGLVAVAYHAGAASYLFKQNHTGGFELSHITSRPKGKTK